MDKKMKKNEIDYANLVQIIITIFVIICFFTILYYNSKSEKFLLECYQDNIQVNCDKFGLNNPFGDGTLYTKQDWEKACLQAKVKVKTANGIWIDCTEK